MSLIFAITAAFSGGISAIFSKLAICRGRVSLVNAVSNLIVLLCFLGDAVLSGSLSQVSQITHWWAILLSGIMLALSWDIYFQALKTGPTSIVIGMQNLSIPLTMIFSVLFLSEHLTVLMLLGSGFILLGAFLMQEQTDSGTAASVGNRWVLQAFLAALFVAVSYIFTKVDTGPVSSSVSGFLRYAIVVAVLFIINRIRKEPEPEAETAPAGVLSFWIPTVLCGIFLGLSYVFLYRAIALGSVTIPTTIARSNLVIVAVFSALILHEPMGLRKIFGIVWMLAGLVLFTLASA